MSKARTLEAVQKLDLDSLKQLLQARPALLSVTDRQGRNLLHLACSASSKDLKLPQAAAIRMVDFLLDHGLNIDTPVGRDACTALFFAVQRSKNPALVRHLIKRGAKPANAPGGGLYAAGWFEDTEMLDILIRAGSDIDIAVGMTPFLACWYWKKFEAARFLAAKGANVNYRDPKNGKTALHYGVEKEFDPAQLKWLVAHGASPDIEDNKGITARLMASRKRNKKFFAALA